MYVYSVIIGTEGKWIYALFLLIQWGDHLMQQIRGEGMQLVGSIIIT